MKKGYIAGKLFKKADQVQRMFEKKVLIEEVPTVDFFNPLSDNPANDKSKLPTAHDIFAGDTKKVIESDYIIAELDDEDAGVCVEIGIAYGINYMRNLLKEYIVGEGDNIDNYDEVDKVLLKILDRVPEKDVITHLSDLRLGTSGEYDGRYVPFGSNQFLIGCVEEMGVVLNNFEECVDMVKKLEEQQ